MELVEFYKLVRNDMARERAERLVILKKVSSTDPNREVVIEVERIMRAQEDRSIKDGLRLEPLEPDDFEEFICGS